MHRDEIIVTLVENFNRSQREMHAAFSALLDAFAASVVPEPAKPKYHIPGPYEIALAVGAALATSGKYETPGAALEAAWMALPEYWTGRDRYMTEMVPMMAAMKAAAGQASPLPEAAYDPRADIVADQEAARNMSGHETINL